MMHNFIKAVGGILAAIGLVIAGMALSTQAGGFGQAGKVYALAIGFSIMVPGAILYCFGAIVEHLAAIRKNGEKQLAIFDKLGRPKE